MSKKLIILLLFILSLFPSYIKQAEGNVAVKSEEEKEEIVYKKLDKEAQILANYLASFDSPLQYHAQDFVDAAREYGLDWKMLPAIAGVESTFGKQIPGGFNGWGWGVYGSQAIYFNSWKEGIFTVSKGLKEDYISRGLTDPYSMNRRYAASPHWGGKVTYFMNEIEKFAVKFESEKKDLVEVQAAPKIAALSGQLVLK